MAHQKSSNRKKSNTHSLPVAYSGEVNDRSETRIGHMVLPQLLDLPRNESNLKKGLFPDQQQRGKLPVTKIIYQQLCASMCKTVRVERDKWFNSSLCCRNLPDERIPSCNHRCVYKTPRCRQPRSILWAF